MKKAKKKRIFNSSRIKLMPKKINCYHLINKIKVKVINQILKKIKNLIFKESINKKTVKNRKIWIDKDLKSQLWIIIIRKSNQENSKIKIEIIKNVLLWLGFKKA